MTLTFASGDVLEHPQLNNMVRALNGDGVVSGLAVSENSGTANMSVDVALGVAKIDSTLETESGVTDLTIEASHATLHRKDLITYDATADTPAVIKGISYAGGASHPIYPPSIPAGDILLAIVKVDAGATIIENADITDCRIFVEKGWTYSGASVFTGDAPTSWTDLVLSSVIGSNRALVVLKLKNTDAAVDSTFSFRPNGDGDDYSYGSGDANPSSFEVVHSKATLVTVQTDATGKIEWECATSGTASTIHVMSYVKLTS